MKVLFVASELNPLIKTGGLADVISALPKALVEAGVDVRIAIPDYPILDVGRLGYKHQPAFFKLSPPNSQIECLVTEVAVPQTEIPVFLFKTSRGLESEEIYPDASQGDQDRFLLFNIAVVEWLKSSPWQPDVIHCHDWMTSAIPSLLQQRKLPIPTLLTIHNLMYQGVTKTSIATELGIKLPTKVSNVNLLMLGIKSATKVNTVSPTYAKEVSTHEYGWGLETVINRRQTDFSGILNGIDTQVFDPTSDPHLDRHYHAHDLVAGKAANKADLQSQLGLEVRSDRPLYGLVSRLEDQKGLEILAAVLSSTPFLEHAQVVILGKGDPYWERRLQNLATSRPQAMNTTIAYDEQLARRIYAASDFFLVPSRFEPCGLTQMIAMRYGSLPIVRHTGGLADTVVDVTTQPDAGTGLVFEEYSAKALSRLLGKSLGLFQDSTNMAKVAARAMGQDFSWTQSAQQYIELYKSIV